MEVEGANSATFTSTPEMEERKEFSSPWKNSRKQSPREQNLVSKHNSKIDKIRVDDKLANGPLPRIPDPYNALISVDGCNPQLATKILSKLAAQQKLTKMEAEFLSKSGHGHLLT